MTDTTLAGKKRIDGGSLHAVSGTSEFLGTRKILEAAGAKTNRAPAVLYPFIFIKLLLRWGIISEKPLIEACDMI